MLGLNFSSKLDWGSHVISIAKTASKEMGVLICSMKIHSLEVGLYLCKSMICPYMEYCVTSGLVPLVATWNCWSFTYCFTWTLAHHWNVASLSLFYRYLVDVLQNWLNWFHFLFLRGGLLIILIDCMIFPSPFLDVARMSMSTVSFLA